MRPASNHFLGSLDPITPSNSSSSQIMFREFDADTILEHIEIARSSGYVFSVSSLCSQPPPAKNFLVFYPTHLLLMALGSSHNSQALEEADPASLMI
jgi:hypothetical protein